MNKPELLAPAGELKSAYGALNAGADAVYLGAPEFSARAYANNLTIDEIILVLKYAHLHRKKIYLAINILMKNNELSKAYDILKPLYEAGLDGVIVQDIGLISLIHKAFPDMEIHASTQMAICSSLPVNILRERYGITRIVPARELSLNEIKDIKNTGIEVECFIHGAMCYCYSGKCLFSSIAGGRSGNRGRCAGPCRKAYDTFIDGKKLNRDNESYPISMRDMCTIRNIGALIDAGVDSFKIEGRMKSPEYSAGVVAVYRKAIDEYIEYGVIKNVDKYEQELQTLYMRTGASTGYLYERSGRDMVSLSSPSYKSISDDKAKIIYSEYIENNKKLPVDFSVRAYVGEPLLITASCNGKKVNVKGSLVEAATKRATDEETFIKQLKKTGATFFEANNIIVDTDNQSFVMVSEINELRRSAIEKIENALLYRRTCDVDGFELSDSNINDATKHSFRIGVKTLKQLEIVQQYDFYDAIIIDYRLADAITDKENYYISLPAIIRQDRIKVITKLLSSRQSFAGVYVSSLDGYALASEYYDKSKIIADFGMYAFNNSSEEELLDMFSSYTASLESSGKELRGFKHNDNRQIIVYGYIPLMYTGNCILKTFKGCNPNAINDATLRDEGGRTFNIEFNHEMCFNIIYNCVPMNLYPRIGELVGEKLASIYRIDFTIENEDITKKVMDLYDDYNKNGHAVSGVLEGNTFTLGLYKRGAE